MASNEYMPSITSNADTQGFRVHRRNIFKVMSHCSVIMHPFAIQKDGDAPALMDVKWFFHVQINRSAMLV